MSIEGCYDREVAAITRDFEDGAISREEYIKLMADIDRERRELERDEDRRNEGPGWGNR